MIDAPPTPHFAHQVTDQHRELVREILAQQLSPDFIERSAAVLAESEARAVDTALRDTSGFYRDLSEACDHVGIENARLSKLLAASSRDIERLRAALQAIEQRATTLPPDQLAVIDAALQPEPETAP